MNLLFLTPQAPYPPRQGTAIRNWGLVRHLSRRHTITLLTFLEPGQAAPAGELLEACQHVAAIPAPARTRWDRVRTLLSPEPDLARRLWSPAFAAALRQLLREQAFDGLHVEGLELAPYLAGLDPALTPRRVIYDAHNVEYLLQRRAARTDLARPARWPAALYSHVQWRRLRRLEAEVGRAVSAVTCVSPEDAAALAALVPGLRPVLVPNGIDVDDYAGFAAEASGPAVVFTGKMDYRPNVDAVLWFAREIWPRLRARVPAAEGLIVGQKPTPAVRALHGQAGLVVTGAVEDTRPYIARAGVYVAPLRMGGGTRFKLLEAMALGRPIVSTTVGAEGFPVTSGQELILADEPASFAEAVADLLGDEPRARALAAAGRAFVRARYDWRVIIPAVEALYAEA